jgi:hypothetical protein
VHAVDEIDVGPAGRSVHHPGARREAPKGMRGAVLGPAVGLDLDQPSPEDLALDLTHQELAENVARHLQGVAIEEFGTQQPSIRMLSWAGHRCNIGRTHHTTKGA